MIVIHFYETKHILSIFIKKIDNSTKPSIPGKQKIPKMEIDRSIKIKLNQEIKAL